MQTITTKYFGPGNVRGSRYKAQASGGFTLWHNTDDRLSNEDNHLAAAQALIAKLGWGHDPARGDTYGDWYQGGTKDGYVYVCCVDYAKVPTIANVPEAK